VQIAARENTHTQQDTRRRRFVVIIPSILPIQMLPVRSPMPLAPMEATIS